MDDEVLINAVRDRPILYNKRLAQFKDRTKRDAAWREVAEISNETVDYVQKRWKLLRDRFARSKKCIVTHSGDEGGIPPPQWELMECMNFIQGFIHHRNLRKGSALSRKQNIESFGSSMPLKMENIDMSLPEEETEPNNAIESDVFFEDSAVSDVSVTSPFTYTSSDVSESQTVTCTGTSTRRRGARRVGGKNVEDALERALKVPRTEDEALGDLVASQLRRMKKCHWMTVSAEIISRMAELHRLYGDDNVI